MKALIRRSLRAIGYDLVRSDVQRQLPPDLSDDEREIYLAVRPYTMTSLERIISLIRTVEYLVDNAIPGAYVECGVWRGGSTMAVALMLQKLGDTSRHLYLYDTFEGMPPPTEVDASLDGTSAAEQLEATPRNEGVWCYADLQDVQAALASTGYPRDRIHLIQGKVEETVPGTVPEAIALLRLDTDWYESTRHELEHLYPLLVERGVLIIDDYGHWRGCRQATDEFFAKQSFTPLLHRIDYTGRLLIKP